MTVILPGGLGQLYGGKPVVAVDNFGTMTGFNNVTTVIAGTVVPSAGATALLFYMFNQSATVTDQSPNLASTWGSGGPALTQIGKLIDTNTNTGQYLYAVTNLTTSGDQSVWFTGTPPTGFIVGMSFNGASKTTPFKNFNSASNASAASGSVTVTSAAGHIAVGAGYAVNFFGFNNTQWFIQSGYGIAGSYALGAASVVFTISASPNGRSSLIGVDVSN